MSGVYASLKLKKADAQKLYAFAKSKLKTLNSGDSGSQIEWCDDSDYHVTVAYSKRNFPISGVAFESIMEKIRAPFKIDGFKVLNGGKESCLVAIISDVRLQDIHNTLLGLGASHDHSTFTGHITLGVIETNADLLEQKLKLAQEKFETTVQLSSITFEDLNEEWSCVANDPKGIKSLFAQMNEIDVIR